MNLAVPSLLILLGLIPGIAFLNLYYSGKFPRALAALTPLSERVLYVLFALPIDALSLRILSGPVSKATLGAIGIVFGAKPALASGQSIYALLEGYGWWKVLGLYALVVAC